MTNIQQEIAELKQRLAELEAKVQTGLEWPQAGDAYYSLGGTGSTNLNTWDNMPKRKARLERGLIFRTREEAERADKKRIAIAEWDRLAGDQSWIDWENGNQNKHHPAYDHDIKRWVVLKSVLWTQKWPFAHYRTDESCRAAIAAMGEKMDWILL